MPACPLWSVRDLVAHLTGVAEDSLHGRFFDGAVGAWADPALAVRREAWTAGQVEARRDLDRDRLVAELERHGQALVRALRRGDSAATDVPAWMIGAPVADLAVHLDDLREALGLPPEPDTLVGTHGFAGYRAWLGDRLAARRTRAAAARRPDRPVLGVGARWGRRSRRLPGGGRVRALPGDQRETPSRGRPVVVLAG